MTSKAPEGKHMKLMWLCLAAAGASIILVLASTLADNAALIIVNSVLFGINMMLAFVNYERACAAGRLT